MKVDVLDLFSGCGGFSLGLKRAEFEIGNHYFSEVDKYAIANYKHNFKDAEYVGAVQDVREIKADIITFGSPCQDFSLAGKRKGMDGSRSSLILEAIRIISETKPSVFIWENVKGTFSSNGGADFWAILAAFANIGDYRLEWQLLNTSWILPQNRERIYLVGHLAGRSEPGVFPIRESNTGINERTTNTSIARAFTAGGNSGGHHSSMTLVKQINESKEFGDQPRQQNRVYSTDGLSPCLNTAPDKVHKITVNPVLTPDRLEKRQQYAQGLREVRTEVAKMQRSKTGSNDFRGKKIEPRPDNITGALLGSPTIDNSIMITSNTSKGVEEVKEGDSINFSQPNSKTRRGRVGKGKAQTLDTQANQGVLEGAQIRRLTEIECERLQGFPDNWTQYGNFNGETKEISRTQRYKMLGNAVTVDVVAMVASRLKIMK